MKGMFGISKAKMFPKKIYVALCLCCVMVLLMVQLMPLVTLADTTETSVTDFEGVDYPESVADWKIGMGDGELLFAAGNPLQGENTLQFNYDVSADQTRIHFTPAGEPVGGDGFKFLAAAPTPVKMRLNVCKGWVQAYVEILVDSTPREYTIRYADLTPYGDALPVNAGMQFIYFVVYAGFNSGVEGFQNKSCLFLDDFRFFSGTDVTNASGTELDKTLPTVNEGVEKAEETLIHDFNEGTDPTAFANFKLALGEGALRFAKGSALEGAQTLQLSYDVSAADSQTRFAYEPAGEPSLEDGIKFLAAAPTPVRMRITACKGWEQAYVDLLIDTQPKEYTLRWEDLTPFPGSNYSGSGGTQFVYFTVYAKGVLADVEGFRDAGCVFFDNFRYFKGENHTSADGVPMTGAVLPIENDGKVVTTVTYEVDNFNAYSSIYDVKTWQKKAGSVATLRFVKETALEGTATLQFGYDVSAADVDRLDYTTDARPAYEGFKIKLAATSPTVIRISACMDNYEQRYYDLYVDTTPREYTIRWNDGSVYPGGKGFDVYVNKNLLFMYFNVMKSAQPAGFENTGYVFLDDVRLFTGDDRSTTNTDGYFVGSDLEVSLPTVNPDDEQYSGALPPAQDRYANPIDDYGDLWAPTENAQSMMFDDFESYDLGSNDLDFMTNWRFAYGLKGAEIVADGAHPDSKKSIKIYTDTAEVPFGTIEGHTPNEISNMGNGIQFWAKADQECIGKVAIFLDYVGYWVSFNLTTEWKLYQIPYVAFWGSPNMNDVIDVTPGREAFVTHVSFIMDMAMDGDSGYGEKSILWVDDYSVIDFDPADNYQAPEEGPVDVELEGVFVHADGGILPAGASVSAEDMMPDSEELAAIQQAAGSACSVFVCKNIEAFTADGSPALLSGGKVRLAFDLPETVDADKVQAFRLYIDGTAEKLDLTIEEGKAVLELYELGKIALAVSTGGSSGNNQSGGNVPTGYVFPLTMAMTAAGSLAIAVICKKRRKVM